MAVFIKTNMVVLCGRGSHVTAIIQNSYVVIRGGWRVLGGCNSLRLTCLYYGEGLEVAAIIHYAHAGIMCGFQVAASIHN